MKSKKGGTPRTPKPFSLYVPRVVVKFRDYFQVPYEDGIEKYFERFKIREWSSLKSEFPGLHFKRLFPETNPEKLKALVQRAVELDDTYKPVDFAKYFAVDCYDKIEPRALAKRLSALDIVEVVYQEGGPVEPPVNQSDDPRFPNQDYLDAAPGGIDAVYAWTFAGGDGNGIGFVDLERGWTLNHEDLTGAGITLISGINTDYHGHGTAVLGEVVAVDNTIGCVGIAPEATARVVSQWRSGGTYNTAQAILDAVAVMNFGDVLLLEAQTSTASATGYVPVEVEQAAYDAIRLGTALGIVIVEAGANGSEDLDAYNDPVDGFILNRGSADFRDSGAIMVGAGSSAAPHSRLSFSNFGSRIDCYGWGQNINTTGDGWTGTGTSLYTTSFGGTSGASPIITGAALVLQGIAENAFGYRFSPRQMRAILSNPANGTASATPATDEIGVMPDLRTIIDNVLNISPDIYIRDFAGDTGDPHNSGSISSSPDIIVRPTAVANPQTSFGEGSGTENSNTLGSEVEQGQDNFIYVRVNNRGGADAANVNATVYWSPPATLVTPDLWNLIGSINIPSVPSGDILTVSNALTWPSAAIPAPGHYCFVGLVGNAEDPAPGPADFMDWNNFTTFIKNNNNVAWRNFNVANNAPPPNANPPGFVQLPFLLKGAPDKARVFDISILSRLPKDGKLLLEVPYHLVRLLKSHTPFVKPSKNKKTVYIPLNPHGAHPLKEILLPAKFSAACSLLVQIPKQYVKHAYRVAIRQQYENLEVGRITWMLTPTKK